MENHIDETELLVPIGNNIADPHLNHPISTNSHPIPANRLALDAQIQAAASYQRRLRQRRRIYYIVLITGITMTIFSILCFIAWIISNSTANNNQERIGLIKSNNLNYVNYEASRLPKADDFHKSTLSARKNPTRTISNLIKRSEEESDEEKDEPDQSKLKNMIDRKATRTRKLSFAPEKVIDYRRNEFHPIKK